MRVRRAGLGIVIVAVLGLAGSFQPALACHFGGLGCGPSENQPFDPQVTITLSDDRTSAHPNLTYKFTEHEHDQFPVSLKVDFDKAFGADLDAPVLGEKIADLSIVAVINGAQTTLAGRIFDHNDAAHGHPTADGTYHWIIEIDSPTPGMPPSDFDGFASKKGATAPFHFEFTLPDTVITNAMAVGASVLEVKGTFFGVLGSRVFLTNPAAAGTYPVTSSFTAWDNPMTPETPPTVVKTTNVPIAARVPSSVSVTPANTTLVTGQTYTATATVLDQKNEALVGASVNFDVTAGAHAGAAKCHGVITDAAGKASCSYTESTGGTDTLTATATANGVSKSATATVKWRAPTTLTLAADAPFKRTGETSTITATLTDQDGAALTGQTITFNRSGTNGADTKTATTNAAGQAIYAYSGVSTGEDTITASINALSKSVTVTWYAPAVASVSVTSANAQVGQTATVTATVLDQHERAMQGVSVAFEVTAGPNTGTTGSATTDAAGKASFSYSSSATGTDTVTAAAGGESGTGTVTWNNTPQPTPTDQDGDGIINTSDNCPSTFNPDQADNDGDHFGNACDGDDDNDSLQDNEESPNGCDPFVADTDRDGLNDWQEVKGYHTSCANPDSDGDGLNDGRETQIGTSPTNPDSDGDGVRDGADNCPTIRNPDQKDSNGDGIGDSCQPGIHICVNGICTGSSSRYEGVW
jgi:hypothetical protein